MRRCLAGVLARSMAIEFYRGDAAARRELHSDRKLEVCYSRVARRRDSFFAA